jgi:uncharacterized membrane protein
MLLKNTDNNNHKDAMHKARKIGIINLSLKLLFFLFFFLFGFLLGGSLLFLGSWF